MESRHCDGQGEQILKKENWIWDKEGSPELMGKGKLEGGVSARNSTILFKNRVAWVKIFRWRRNGKKE